MLLYKRQSKLSKTVQLLRLLPCSSNWDRWVFTVEIATDPRALTIVDAVGRMARELDVALVAEGIETAEQRGALVATGCSFGQGYLLARPMSADLMRSFLQPAHRSSPAEVA